MLRIEPIDAQTCSEHVGRPVCAVLSDGSHYYGYLDKVDKGKLHLHNAVQGEGKLTVSAGGKRREAKKASVLPYAPYSYPGAGPVVLDLALVSYLYALPFHMM